MTERPYEQGDLSRVMETYTVSITVWPLPTIRPCSSWLGPLSPDPAPWRERLSQRRTIVAELEGRLAGFVSYNDEGYLDLLFTHPAFARRGVASSLYRRVESAVR